MIRRTSKCEPIICRHSRFGRLMTFSASSSSVFIICFITFLSSWSETKSDMSTCFGTPVLLSGLFPTRDQKVWLAKPRAFVTKPEEMAVLKRPLRNSGSSGNFSVSAEYKSGGGGDFAAGFLLGGAVFGTLAYVFAPQIRRTLLNEDEYGFRKAKQPIYYDGGLERTRKTLNEKINQLNSAIDNVSSRLRGGKQFPPAPIEIDS